jgi:hypothetical protein
LFPEDAILRAIFYRLIHQIGRILLKFNDFHQTSSSIISENPGSNLNASPAVTAKA